MKVNKDILIQINKLLNSNRPFCVFDIETTGFSAQKGSKITEIGAVKVENMKITDRYSQLINPFCVIPSNIIELTGITNEMVADKPGLKAVLPEFLKFAGQDILVAHNGKMFDQKFVSYFVEMYYGHELENDLIDTLYMARHVLPNLENHKLNTVAEALNIDLVNHHRAVDDAYANAEIFIALSSLFKVEKEKTHKQTKLSLINNAVVKNEIKSIQSWTAGQMNRLYVNLSLGTIFYDFKSDIWGIKNYNGEPDYEDIEKEVLKKINCKKIEEAAGQNIKMVG